MRTAPSMRATRSRWQSQDGRPGRDVGHHDGPHPDDRVRQRWVVPDHAAHPRKDPVAELRTPADDGPRADMGKRTDDRVMLHNRVSVDDRLGPDLSPRIHNRASEHDGPRTKDGRGETQAAGCTIVAQGPAPAMSYRAAAARRATGGPIPPIPSIRVARRSGGTPATEARYAASSPRCATPSRDRVRSAGSMSMIPTTSQPPLSRAASTTTRACSPPPTTISGTGHPPCRLPDLARR